MTRMPRMKQRCARPMTATHDSIVDLGFRYFYVGAADVQR